MNFPASKSPVDGPPMLDIYRIKVPTPYRIGPVNTYLVKTEPITLIDPGPETDEAKEALLGGLAGIGVGPGQIKRVVITHSDSDHSGLARWLSGLAGAKVYVHRFEVRKMTFDYDYYSERTPFLEEAGLPLRELKEILEDFDPVAKPVLPRSGVVELLGGEVLQFISGALKVYHLPGHSGGHICLYDEAGGLFLGGDFILKHITPNPVMEANPADFKRRSPALSQYLAGLNLLDTLPVRIILPGHGEYINDSCGAAARAREHHTTRLKTVMSFLRGEWLCAYRVMRALYPRIRGFQVFLGISEALAHIDYLYAGGRLESEKRGGVTYYREKENV